MSDAYEDQQLFGAPLGDLSGVSLQITFCEGRVSVVLHGHAVNRSAMPTLYVRSSNKDDTNTIVGALSPILLRCKAMNVANVRRHMWASHNRLGREGFEVEIKNCGREPKH